RSMNLQHHDSPEQLVQRLAAWIADRLQQAMVERGHAVLAVSGGRSPVALFQALRTKPIDWSRVSVSLVDERCVPPDHPDSNSLLLRTHLLKDAAQAARFVPWFDELPATLDD